MGVIIQYGGRASVSSINISGQTRSPKRCLQRSRERVREIILLASIIRSTYSNNAGRTPRMRKERLYVNTPERN
jgi:hypothetical protein